MQPIKIGLLGLGTVGGGTVSVLTRNTDEITRRIGHRVEITMAAAKEYKANSIAGLDQIGMITEDPYSVVNNPCLLYTSPSPRDRQKSRMPSSA